MNNYLTLIVPLFDRHELTDRVLSNLDEQQCEFKIIVADGSFEKWEDEQEKYDNLDIEYFYDGPDVNIAKFLKKMSRAAQMVNTPLVMVFDNDDLIDLAGIRNGVSFMSKNPDYSSYQNDVRTLELEPTVTLYESLYQNRSVEQEEPADRLDDVIKNFNSFNYAIFRTAYIQSFFGIMDFLDNDDFQFFQKSWAYTSAILGKCKRLQSESYYYFIPGASTLQDGRIHKFSQWAATRYWNCSGPRIISMITSLHQSLYQEDIRERFATTFINEIFDKGHYGQPDGDFIGQLCELSLNYDSQTQEAISKCSFEPESFDYSCNALASHEEFLKCLNT